MKDISLHYLRRCAAWATALQEKYKSDLLFRAAARVVALQGLFLIACIAALSASLLDPSIGVPAFLTALLLAGAVGILLVRLTLVPARETLSYQKLFISNVAHELRTPLSIIKTSTEVALIDDSLPPSMRATLREITGELDRLSEILNNLLSLNTLTRPERMHFSHIELGTIVSMVMKRHTSLARERDIRLLVRAHPHPPVWGNAVALEQVVTNIIKNAISYTPKHTRGTVTATIEQDGDMVRLSVSDTGIGISQEDLVHIFEPFYRADMSRVRTVKKSGTGLGLTIVNEIVRVHRGKIQIQSTLKKGTVVSVMLPSTQPLEVKPVRSSMSLPTFWRGLSMKP